MARKPTTEIKICFANATCALTDKDGTAYVLKRGDCWAADDPLPLFRPDFFDPLPALDSIHRTYLPDGFDRFGDPIPEWHVGVGESA
jgi:hypothetical protein